MLVVRSVTLADAAGLLALAQLAGVGLTTLPKDAGLLDRRIRKSVDSMSNVPDRPGGESYLFVMEDTAADGGAGEGGAGEGGTGEGGTGRLVGASGVVSKVGGFEPFYAYRLERLPQRCDQLGVNRTLPVLHLTRDHDGPAEVGSLFLRPDYRGGNAGRFLQLVRFLFVAGHRSAFEETIVSELRGVVDADGTSPFWDALGRHFFEISFAEADRLSVVGKRFIADLMPTHPIYLGLLPPAAQAVVGQVHDHSRPALRTLEGEGFRFDGRVDIFDGGPCVSCRRDDVRTVRQCRTERVAAVRPGTTDEAGAGVSMVARSGGPFRACLDRVDATDGGVTISAEAAAALAIGVGDPVSVAPLRPAAAGG